MSTTPHNAPLDELRRRRAELRQSMGALEFAIAAPVRDDPARWADEVAHAMRALESDFRDHLDVTEGAKGLYQDLRSTAPRLSRRITRLADEHQELSRLIAEVDELIAAAPAEPAKIPDLRRTATRMLSRLAKHRQRGSDLVWDAYAFDVGGEN